MQWFLATVLAFTLQAAASDQPGSLAGKWVSTVKPGPGEAPAIWPAFSIEQKEKKLVVTFDKDATPYEATSYELTKGVSLLTVKMPPTPRGTKLVVIRPLPGGQVRLELYTEYPDGDRRRNFYYEEVFKKGA